MNSSARPLAEGGAIVDHRDALGFQRFHRILPGIVAAVVVVAHHAEAGVKALLRVAVAGGDRRHLSDAGVVVDARRRDAGAGVPVADHAGHAFVDQTLRDGHGGARIGLIVLGQQFEGDRFAVQRRLLRVGVGDRQARAVFEIFADACGRAGQRPGQPINTVSSASAGRLRIIVTAASANGLMRKFCCMSYSWCG